MLLSLSATGGFIGIVAVAVEWQEHAATVDGESLSFQLS